MTEPNLVVHPHTRAEGDGIWFAVPPGFVSLPLGVLLAPVGTPEQEELSAALTPLLASAPDETSRRQFTAVLASVQQMIYTLRREGTVHFSLGLHRDDIGNDETGALISVFTITWVDTSWAPRGVIAARAVTAAENHTHIAYDELPCGPAAFSEILRTAKPDSGLPQEPLLQFHAYLPHPDGTSLALLTLSTTAVRHRERYRTLLRHIAQLVAFDDPLTKPAEGEKNQ